MNCEKYQDLLSDFLDGSLTPEDHNRVEAHLSACGGCAEARNDLDAIVVFCQENRGEYEAVPNEHALWLRISNTIESELPGPARTEVSAGWWSRLMNQRWQLSFPQLAASLTAIVIIVSLVTIVGLRRFSLGGAGVQAPTANNLSLTDRYRQQQQRIAYWNQRVELNKLRWNAQMRDTFDRNMSVIDAAVNESMGRLKQNPHDEVSEEILNGALNDKEELLREFADL
jgi:anti-sigma factor RsiW